MRAIYVYSKHDYRQIVMMERVVTELGGYLTIVEFDECPDMIKKLVRETPCLIHAEEHLQGIELLKDDVDGKLLLTAEMYERMDRSERALHDVDNSRLDSFINGENRNSIDSYTMELIMEGKI